MEGGRERERVNGSSMEGEGGRRDGECGERERGNGWRERVESAARRDVVMN